jgi:phytoene synthase
MPMTGARRPSGPRLPERMLSLDDSYRYAESITRANARNFYYGFRSLTPERRRAIHAVYAFSRRADDAVDSMEARPGAARAELGRLLGLLGSEASDDPLAPALRDAIRRFSIERQPFELLIEGMELDLVKHRYETFEDLEAYCYRAASVIGLVCLPIFGYRDEAARKHAVDLGIAMQLTNIIRDVDEDRRRGRIYIPLEELRRFGCSEAAILSGREEPGFPGLVKFQVDRAREFFRRAMHLFPLLDAESRPCPKLLMRFYERILDKIEARGYAVLGRRIRLPWHEKIFLAGSAWIEARISG